jgi:hypothetical protein
MAERVERVDDYDRGTDDEEADSKDHVHADDKEQNLYDARGDGEEPARQHGQQHPARVKDGAAEASEQRCEVSITVGRLVRPVQTRFDADEQSADDPQHECEADGRGGQISKRNGESHPQLAAD